MAFEQHPQDKKNSAVLIIEKNKTYPDVLIKLKGTWTIILLHIEMRYCMLIDRTKTVPREV